MQWLGGIGIVVLAVALLPMLGVGGMQLLRAETPGPVEGLEAHAAHHRNGEGAVAHLRRDHHRLRRSPTGCAGMTPFDAIAHSFSTVSTGGNSTHDASFGYFDNAVIEVIAVFFMFLGGVNFSLHFLAWRHKRVSSYFRDPEFRAFFWVLALGVAVYFVVLWLSRPDVDPGDAFRLLAVPRHLDADQLRLLHRRLLALARRAAGDPDAVDVHRRLRRLDVRRHEGRALAADVETGAARSRAARAPERGDAGQARREADRSAHHRRRVGFLRASTSSRSAC